jgi:chromosome segregation ATPase
MAEQPVMDSATENPSESVAPTPKPLKTGEAAEALKNLLNPEASKTQTTASEELSKDVSDSETNIEEPFDDPELIDQIEEEETSNSNQELYKVNVDGQKLEVTLDELMKGYSRQSDYTRKTEKLSQDRKGVEDLKNEYTRQNEEAKIKRDQYEKQIQILSEQLKQAEPSKADFDNLYENDPAEYVRLKAEQDRRKELMEKTRIEQERIAAEKREEQTKQYNVYLDQQRKLLAEKLPIYADKEKGADFIKNLTSYAKSIGYTDQEIAMLVDHRAVLMLANAYRYDKLKKANLKNKKVTKVSRVVSSSSAKVQDDNEVAKRIKSKKAALRKTGKVNDAVSVLQELYSQPTK